MIKQVETITRYHHLAFRICSVGRVTYSDMTYDYALIKGSVQVGNLVKVRKHRKVRCCQCHTLVS